MRLVLLVATLTVVVHTTASADVILPTIPIRVTGGSVVTQAGSRIGDPESGPTHGVHLIGPNFELSGSGTGPMDCHVGCSPGQAFSMSADIFVRRGTVTFEGRTVEFDALFGPIIGGASVDLFALSPSVAPDDVSSGTLFFRSRFTLEGSASVPDFVFAPDGEPIPAIRSWSLTGSGTATGAYSFVVEQEQPLFRFDTIVFDFDGDTAPIPEPGTMLLVAGGMATMGRRRCRTSRVRD